MYLFDFLLQPSQQLLLLVELPFHFLDFRTDHIDLLSCLNPPFHHIFNILEVMGTSECFQVVDVMLLHELVEHLRGPYHFLQLLQRVIEFLFLPLKLLELNNNSVR